MNHMDFLWDLDDQRVVAAIREAEARTSGEIRVYVSPVEAADPVETAKAHFVRMGMTATRRRNGVLIFFAPESRTFAVVGDEAAHDCVGGEAFWSEIVREMRRILVKHSPTDAVVFAIRQVADALCDRFPREFDDVNELPDQVERG